MWLIKSYPQPPRVGAPFGNPGSATVTLKGTRGFDIHMLDTRLQEARHHSSDPGGAKGAMPPPPPWLRTTFLAPLAPKFNFFLNYLGLASLGIFSLDICYFSSFLSKIFQASLRSPSIFFIQNFFTHVDI